MCRFYLPVQKSAIAFNRLFRYRLRLHSILLVRIPPMWWTRVTRGISRIEDAFMRVRETSLKPLKFDIYFSSLRCPLVPCDHVAIFGHIGIDKREVVHRSHFRGGQYG